ncbi:MAG TPA: hypothetical protein VJZ99_02605 [Patescibacteria group bacterium]|nr:hypothetical protein [Patescibacteria group bacterium]
MLKWINFLHLYQPVNSDAYKIEEALNLSYRRIFQALEDNRNIKFTFNISGGLISRLADLKEGRKLITKINKLINRGQVELVGSAAYHALLPLISEAEVIDQIKEQELIIKKHFPQAKLKGFFLPEMAFSSKVAKIIKAQSYQWLILDEISYAGKEKINYQETYLDSFSNLKIIFRSRRFSNSYIPETVETLLNNDMVLITASDGELYGLRHHDLNGSLERVLKNSKIETRLISDFIKNFKNPKKINLRSSNWESTIDQLKARKPFYLWYNKDNEIQMKLWKLAQLSEKMINKYPKDINHSWARWHFVRGLASCTFWWASAYDFKHNFGPKAWSPDEIERGVDEFIRAIRSLENSTTLREKRSSEELLILIKRLVWLEHWTYQKKYE